MLVVWRVDQKVVRLATKKVGMTDFSMDDSSVAL